ncbi:hypothetical protein WOLCODRAFT_141749 [Wolfiporia cocos MD-104 SS10]|uniref:STE3-domain-containing protein n=1 Tax=Wolfiporia cocos (strain MD-104) TaxID=742152 RepID=A0A2H3J4J7_WOLCO|nr:hypothetical protein WOLCODRAFT_141749 [Wolfiporia cocos MD-104 SS10]
MAVPLKITVVVLELSSIILLSALLATPARRHPIVNTIVVLSVIRSVFDIMPSLLYLIRYKVEFENLVTHPPLARFCLANDLVLNYLTVVKSAFATSFTFPCLYLALKFTRGRSVLDSDATPQFYRWTEVLLCAGPFVWALPTGLIPIPKMMHDLSKLKPQLRGSTCTMANSPSQIVSLILMLVPLTFAVITSLLLIVILCTHYKLPDFRQSFRLLHPIRIIRFAFLVATIIVSAILYSIVLAMWVRVQHDDIKWGRIFQAWLATSAIWEAVSPLIFFFIFAAQEEVLTVWRDWLSQRLPWSIRNSSKKRDIVILSVKSDRVPRQHPRIIAWLLDPCGKNGRARACPEAAQHQSNAMISRGDIPKPRGVKLGIRDSVHVDPPRHILSKPCQALDVSEDSGLSPPPRSPRNKDQAPREAYGFKTMPSLTALGGRVASHATEKARRISQSGKEETYGKVDETAQITASSVWVSSEDWQAVTTAESYASTGTFGR